MNKLLLAVLTILATHSFAQNKAEPKTFRITSAYTSFPDTGRAKGHVYNNVLYTAAEHYNDSSVLIIVPPQLKVKKMVDVICWFHGWRNNIDSVPVQFDVVISIWHCGVMPGIVLPDRKSTRLNSSHG